MTKYAFLWNVLLLGSVGYVVFGLGHSGWWFLAATLVFRTSWYCDKCRKNEL